MKVGVLGLQGDVPEHLEAIARLVPNDPPFAVNTPEELRSVDALFLPGGESTTIARLLRAAGLWTPLGTRIGEGLPVLATCAGLILLAARLEVSPSGPNPPTLGAIDVTVRRNDYGAQTESFEGPVRVEGLPEPEFPGVFIRAPRIVEVGPRAQPLAWHGREIVGVRQGALWGLTFHPELSSDPRLHERFLREAAASVRPARSRARPGPP
jgi:pyridoxal 5'-phosphate synthase pdxT subunit